MWLSLRFLISITWKLSLNDKSADLVAISMFLIMGTCLVFMMTRLTA